MHIVGKVFLYKKKIIKNDFQILIFTFFSLLFSISLHCTVHSCSVVFNYHNSMSLFQ